MQNRPSFLTSILQAPKGHTQAHTLTGPAQRARGGGTGGGGLSRWKSIPIYFVDVARHILVFLTTRWICILDKPLLG